MADNRTEFHREVAEALISSKAIDFNSLGGVLSKYGARAAVSGESLFVLIGRNCLDVCIPPEPYIGRQVAQVEAEQ
jgi:hypothetical protein